MKKNIFFLKMIPLAALMLAFLFLTVSCRSKDPMAPYKDLGAPKGFKDTYPVKPGKNNRKQGNGFFKNLFEEEKERKAKFRDVSRPLPRGTVEVFPWRKDERRSEGLYEDIRREKKAAY